ncbi:hypothetical protein BDZ45DRAFT_752733 [Acephala macrosclerotiorum]|nr:hypothetical protein BDZ45DRAFT_752733 [Acephala macrosclerotiorum]
MNKNILYARQRGVVEPDFDVPFGTNPDPNDDSAGQTGNNNDENESDDGEEERADAEVVGYSDVGHLEEQDVVIFSTRSNKPDPNLEVTGSTVPEGEGDDRHRANPTPIPDAADSTIIDAETLVKLTNS